MKDKIILFLNKTITEHLILNMNYRKKIATN